jgi:hypothetical protein
MTQGLLHILRRCSTVSEAEKRLKDVIEDEIECRDRRRIGASRGDVPETHGPGGQHYVQPRDAGAG